MMEEIPKLILLILKSLVYTIQIVGDFCLSCGQLINNRHAIWWVIGVIIILTIVISCVMIFWGN